MLSVETDKTFTVFFDKKTLKKNNLPEI